MLSILLLLTACSPESEISISETSSSLEASDEVTPDLDISQAPPDVLNFIYGYDQLDDGDEIGKRRAIGQAARAVAALENTDRYKRVVVNELIEKYIQEKNPSISVHLHHLIEDNYLYGVELYEENRSQLSNYLSTLDPRNASSADIFIVAAFDADGVDAFLREEIDFRLAINNKTSIDDLANLPRSEIGGPQLWTALKMRARYDLRSLNTVLSIMESTPVVTRENLFNELEVINSPEIKGYLASYIFSDAEHVYLSAGRMTQYEAWYALLSFAKIEENFPFEVVDPGSVNPQSKNKEEARPIILDARDWLLTQPEYDFVKEFNVN